jgi:histone-arginine methyltransferase CARM1
MDALVDSFAPEVLKAPAKAAFADLQVGSLTKDNFLELVSACGVRCVAKCPSSLPAVEVEGFVLEVAAQLWTDRKISGPCPLRELLSQLRVSSEFGPRECAFMTKYFYYFGKMRSHEGMMNDIGRSETYRKAIHGNPDNFKGKIVMDVGSGSGLLAFFAIQAGAKKVYAVEAGQMHEVIRMLADANGWGDKVVVVNKILQDMTEDDCPLNSVDTIIAETLGTFLFGERGIETMLVARDKFLKSGGAIFPTQATLSVAPFSDALLYEQQCAKGLFWETTDFFGIDVSSVKERAQEEQFSQVIHSMVDPDTLVAKQVDIVYDFRTINQASLRNIHVKYNFNFDRDIDEVHGLAGWFIAEFIGSNQTTTLSTAPCDTLTHWFQTRFLITKPLVVKKGDTLTGTMDMMANEQQSYTCSMEMSLGSETRQNSEMCLMDLDSSLKTYAYKIIKHGNVVVAGVDWEKTTQEARQKTAKVMSSSFLGKEMSYADKIFVCVNCPALLAEIQHRKQTMTGKIGENIYIHGVAGDSGGKYGLLRKDGSSGEESFWMDKVYYTGYMIDHIVSRKSCLSGYSVKSDDEIKAHFSKLQYEQVVECYQALIA